MLRYAITDEGYRPGDGERWAAEGVDYVQLRAKTLEASTIVMLARALCDELNRGAERKDKVPKLLLNGRADLAIAAGADGVHLTASSGEVTPEQARQIFAAAYVKPPVISVSTHTLAEVEKARDSEADLILFAPVFEKRVDGKVVVEGVGLDLLGEAVRVAGRIPVLALGGVTMENAEQCLSIGAAGVAGIRMFR